MNPRLGASGALVFVAIFGLIIFQPASARDLDLQDVARTIQLRGAKWRAAETSVSALSFEQKKRLTGARSDPGAGTALPRFRPKGTLALPPTLDWRDHRGGNFVTPIRTQGGCGSCWAFAATAVFESSYLIQANRPGVEFDRSEQELLSCSGGGNCIGGFAGTALEYTAKIGVVDEDCFPYTATDEACDGKCADWKNRIVRAHGVFMVESYYGENEPAKEALQDGPVTMGLSVYEDFFWYGGGIYEHVTGEYVSEHVVEVIGYDDNEQAWICKNSWGTGWGEAGFFKMRYNNFNGGSVFGVQKNRAPVFNWIYTQTTTPLETLSFSVSAVDPDGDGVVYEMEPPPEIADAVFDPKNGVFTWTPPAGSEGIHEVLFRATDLWDPPAFSEQLALISVCSEPCEDHNPCTDDTCLGGICQHANNRVPCPDDLNPCTDELCEDGSCYRLLPDFSLCPDDGSECTTDECLDGVCLHVALLDSSPCNDDYNRCTEDVCRAGACLHEPLPDGSACDDKQVCTRPDVCISGGCQGKLLEECIDGLECTIDSCREAGPHFHAGSKPLDDISESGNDTKLDGDDIAAGPFSIGFDYPAPGATSPKNQFWVSSNGLIAFSDASVAFKNTCPPSFDDPNDWIAPYWDDLVCFRNDGCKVSFEPRGQAPERVLVVQWTGARVFGQKDGSATFQTLLWESGGLEFRYLSLPEVDQRSASIGWESADGFMGVAFSCDGVELRAGMSLIYTDEFTECINQPVSGFCVIDGICYSEGEVNPRNQCQKCSPKTFEYGWTDADGDVCDDRLFCTEDDRCFSGGCTGNTPAICDDGIACTTDSCSDGIFAPGGTLCDHTISPGSCLIDGSCFASGEPSLSNVCLVCSPTLSQNEWSVRDSGACDDGDPCTADDTCQDGRCNGRAYTCPTSECIHSSQCDGLGGCRMSYLVAGTPCREQRCLDGTLDLNDRCDGRGSCLEGGELRCFPFLCESATACAASCETDASCADGFFCQVPRATCVQLRKDGDPCDGDGECLWRHCQNGFCCAAGDCCQRDQDCPEHYATAPGCDDPPRCQGHRGVRGCTLLHECLTRLVDDDSACTADYRFSCRGKTTACNGTPEQEATSCLVPCTTTAACQDDEECRGGVCQPGYPTGDGGETAGGGCGCSLTQTRTQRLPLEPFFALAAALFVQGLRWNRKVHGARPRSWPGRGTRAGSPDDVLRCPTRVTSVIETLSPPTGGFGQETLSNSSN